MNAKVRTRREKVSELLIKNYSEIEIATTLRVSRQTIVRDVSFLKKLSHGWLDGLAKDGFVFEYKLTLQKIKENAAGLQSLLDEAKDVWQKLAIRKAIEPHRTKSDASVIIVSTPNGRRGFFAKIFHNKNTKYYKHTLTWRVADGFLIKRAEVEKIRKEDPERYEQEYNCKFLSAKYSAFPPQVLSTAEQFSEEYQLVD